MVQCDKCEVWQHCECMGLAEEDIPEQYYCEECKPENHVIIKTSSGRTRRTYDANGKFLNPTVDKKAPKKRTTMNSQEASMSLEDILAARQALGLNGNNINTFLTNKSTPSSNHPSTLNGENHDNNNNSNSSTTTGKRKRDDHTNQLKNDNDENNDQATENSPTQAASDPDKDSNHHDNSKTFNTESEDTTTESKPNSAPKATKVKRNGGGKSKIVVLDDNTSANSTESKPTTNSKNHEKKGRQSNNNHSGKRNNGNGNGRKTNHKSRSRTSTPQPNDTILQTNTTSPSVHHSNQAPPTVTNPTNSNNNNNNNNNTTTTATTTTTTTTNFGPSLLEHFSAESRATSPPAKVRYPTSRMSISEMNRRAKQILEYISSIQVDMANSTSVPTNNDDDYKKVTEFSRSTIIVHQQEYKTTSLMTSASSASSSSSASSASTASSSSASASSTSTLENTQLNNKMELDHDHIFSAGADTKQKKLKQQRPSSLIIPEQRFDDGPSSSLSSASTLPLDNSNPGTPKMDLDDDDDLLGGGDRNHTDNNTDKNEKGKHNETSLEIMDMLTRELIKFQRKFGTGNYLHHRRTHSQSDDQQQLQQQDEGRITRSASNTNSVQLAS
ncbi:unnamed protein product [Cunninghamella echinulata]